MAAPARPSAAKMASKQARARAPEALFDADFPAKAIYRFDDRAVVFIKPDFRFGTACGSPTKARLHGGPIQHGAAQAGDRDLHRSDLSAADTAAELGYLDKAFAQGLGTDYLEHEAVPRSGNGSPSSP